MQYDVFLSYRSTDVRVVRTVAEVLLAACVRVWFAEYMIRIENYDEFQVHVDQGLRGSQYLICFLGDGYFDSEYCVDELEQFINFAEDAGRRIAYIDLRDAEKTKSISHEKLNQAPRFAFTGSIEDAVNFIGKQLGRQVPMPAYVTPPARMRHYDYRGQEFQIALPHEWKQLDGFPNQAIKIEDTSYPPLVGRIGDIDVFFTLNVGPDNELIPHRLTGNEEHDREVYRKVLDSTRMYFEQESAVFPSELHGVHLVSVGNHSHASFSRTKGTIGNGLAIWERKYTISLYSSVLDCELEYLLSFGLPKACTEQQFHGVAPAMEEIVYSLKVGGQAKAHGALTLGAVAIALMSLCWLPLALFTLPIKALASAVLFAMTLSNSSPREIKDFQASLGLSVRSTVGQMRRIFLGTSFIVSLIGICLTKWSMLHDWLLAPPSKAVFVFFLLTLAVSFVTRESINRIVAESPETPLARQRFLLNESIRNVFSAKAMHCGLSLGLTAYLLVIETDLHWGLLAAMIFITVMSLFRLIRESADNLTFVSGRPTRET